MGNKFKVFVKSLFLKVCVKKRESIRMGRREFYWNTLMRLWDFIIYYSWHVAIFSLFEFEAHTSYCFSFALCLPPFPGFCSKVFFQKVAAQISYLNIVLRTTLLIQAGYYEQKIVMGATCHLFNSLTIDKATGFTSTAKFFWQL